MAQNPTNPPLDGVPPSPPGLSAGGGPNPTMQQLTPSAQLGGSMQAVQMSLQAAAQAAQLIDLLGQINPPFAPTAQMLIEQLKGGLKSSLQQGMQPSSEPSQQPTMQALNGPQPIAGASQTPLPSLPSGM